MAHGRGSSRCAGTWGVDGDALRLGELGGGRRNRGAVVNGPVRCGRVGFEGPPAASRVLNSKSHISNDSPNVVDIVLAKNFVQSQIRVALDNNINGHQNIVLINRNINKHSRCRRDRYNISSKIITYNILKLLLKKF